MDIGWIWDDRGYPSGLGLDTLGKHQLLDHQATSPKSKVDLPLQDAQSTGREGRTGEGNYLSSACVS